VVQGDGEPRPPSDNPATPGRLDAGLDAVDPIGAALAGVLDKATAAGEWGVVGQIARELESRRIAVAGKVVRIGVARPSRG
jgi:hypothetical protein